MIWSDLQLQIKVRPDFWLRMYQLMINCLGSVQVSHRSGGINVDPAVLTVAEFARRITQNQYFGWINRKKDKVYNYKMPFSVALALCRVVKTLPQDSDHSAVYDTIAVRLHDSGVDIVHYLSKK